MRTAYDLVWMAAERHPDHPALVDDLSERRLSYRQLIAEIDRVAAGLQARGVAAGSRVVVALPNLFESCVVLLALQRLAAVPALLNFRLGSEEIAALARRAEARAALVLPDRELVERLAESLGREAVLLAAGEVAGAEPLSACLGDPAQLSPVPVPEPEAESFLFYTSGTTGLPKAVVLPQRANEPRVTWLSTMLGFRSGTHIRALGVSPLYHAIGFHGVFLATLAYGGTYVTLSNFDPERALDLIERHRINYLFSLPLVYSALRAAPSYRAQRLASLETVYWGGAAIDPMLFESLEREWSGAVFGHVYGTTETMCSLVNATPSGHPEVLFPSFSSRARVVRGEGVDPSELGPDLPDCESGEPGELLVDATGDAVFTCYLGQPGETAAKLRDGWYVTGDAAARGTDGSIRLLGRSDDMIRSGGEFIQPEEVERCLLQAPQVAACAVVGVADRHWGQLTVAAVVPADGVGEIDPVALDRHCRNRLAGFKRPRRYLVIDTLPMGAGGKLQRKKLRQLAEAARAGDGELRWLRVTR